MRRHLNVKKGALIIVANCILSSTQLSWVGREGKSTYRLASGWTVRGSNPGGGGRDIPHPHRPVLGTTQPPIRWVPGLSRGLRGRSVAMTSHPSLEPKLKKE